MIGAEANRLAEPLAASEAIPPRRHFHSGGTKSFELETANLSLSLGVPKGGFSFAKENPPFDPCSAAGAAIPLAPNGRDLIPPNQFGDRISKNPKSFLFDSFALQGL